MFLKQKTNFFILLYTIVLHLLYVIVSHAAITAGRESGVLGNGANANSRPDVARDYLENYVKECKIKKETS